MLRASICVISGYHYEPDTPFSARTRRDPLLAEAACLQSPPCIYSQLVSGRPAVPWARQGVLKAALLPFQEQFEPGLD